MRIVTRAEAGLKETQAIADLPMMKLPARDVFIHHTVTPAGAADPLADWRYVQTVAFGRDFTDISYSFGAHPYLPEAVLEGRGQRVGAHTLDHNETSYGLVAVGNFETMEVPDSLVDSFRWIIWHLKDQGLLVPEAKAAPHRSVYATACPGRNLLARIDQVNVPWVANPPDPAAPRPPMPTPAPLPPVPPAPPPIVVPAFHGRLMRLVSPYMRGEDVREAQKRLRERGWKLDADGVYGPATKDVVTSFQREKKLTVDGILGPATWRALWVDPIT